MVARLRPTFINNSTANICAATFEVCPSDYSCLLMEEAPPTGGDTLWCSSYELWVSRPPFPSTHHPPTNHSNPTATTASLRL